MRADNTSVVIIMLDPPGPPKRERLRRNTPQQFLVENEAYENELGGNSSCDDTSSGDNQHQTMPQVLVNPNSNCTLFEHNVSKTLIDLTPTIPSTAATLAITTAAPPVRRSSATSAALDESMTLAAHSPIPFGYTFDENGDTAPNTLSYEYAYAAAFNPMIHPQTCDPIKPSVRPVTNRNSVQEQKPPPQQQHGDADDDTYSLTCLETRGSSTGNPTMEVVYQNSAFDEPPAAIVTVVTTTDTSTATAILDHQYSEPAAAVTCHSHDDYSYYNAVQHDHHHRYLPPPGSSSCINDNSNGDDASTLHIDDDADADDEDSLIVEPNNVCLVVANTNDASVLSELQDVTSDDGRVAVDDECIVMETEDECMADYLENFDSMPSNDLNGLTDTTDTFASTLLGVRQETNDADLELILSAKREEECSDSNVSSDDNTADDQMLVDMLDQHVDNDDDDVNVQIHEISSSSPKEKENHHHHHNHLHQHHHHRMVVSASVASSISKTATTNTPAVSSLAGRPGSPSPLYRRLPMALRSAKRLSVRLTRSSKLPRTPSFDSRTKKPKTTVKRSVVAHKSPHRPSQSNSGIGIDSVVCIPSRVLSSSASSVVRNKTSSAVVALPMQTSLTLRRHGSRTSRDSCGRGLGVGGNGTGQPQAERTVGIIVQGLPANRTLRSRNAPHTNGDIKTTTPSQPSPTIQTRNQNHPTPKSVSAMGLDHHRRLSSSSASTPVSTIKTNANIHGPRLRDRVKSQYQQLLQHSKSTGTPPLSNVRSLSAVSVPRNRRTAIDTMAPLSSTTSTPTINKNSTSHSLRTRGSSSRLLSSQQQQPTMITPTATKVSLLSLSSCLSTANTQPSANVTRKSMQRATTNVNDNMSAKTSSSSTKVKVAAALAAAAAATSRSRFRKRLTR